MPDPNGASGVGPNKAIAAGAAGAVTIILVWAVQTWGHVAIPAEVASSFTTLLAAAAAYLVPHGGG